MKLRKTSYILEELCSILRFYVKIFVMFHILYILKFETVIL